jgi:very-short-patch-repair endonuclease
MECFWCGKEAIKILKESKKPCCSEKHTLCSGFQSKVTYAIEIVTTEVCYYGCGNIAKYIFYPSNKLCCSNRLQSCQKIKEKNSLTNKEKQSGEKNGMYGKTHSKDSIEKNRQANIKLWKDPDSIFNSKEWKEKLSKAMNARPNYPEKIILEFLSENLKNFKYTGDFSFWVGRKNPDFVDIKNKKVIDFFGRKFHNEDEVETRSKYFRERGYEILIIWEDELRNNKDVVFNRILEFGGMNERRN